MSELQESSNAITPQERALARDNFVRAFEQQFSNWVSIAKCCSEVRRDKDYELLGFETFAQWMMATAPRSRSYIYLAIARYEELIPDIPESELQDIPLGSAGILKQLSSSVRRQSKIRQAAKQKPSDLRQVLKESAPEQHIEVLEVRTLRFTASQAEVFDEMLAGYRAINENEASAEEAVEWLASQWLDSKWEEGPHSNRQRAQQIGVSL
jgi:hypothetical protein